MEKECLDFMLRGTQPVSICPARYPKRAGLPRHWQAAIDNSQVLILSSFGPLCKRTSRQASFTRNQLVASLSKAILVPHASSGGMAERVVEQCLAERIDVLTFQDDANAQILQRGAVIYSSDDVRRLFTT
jgi:predicted Rossmann fold nucleotide-binding protein DprA/Smf involved in DNA uptake